MSSRVKGVAGRLAGVEGVAVWSGLVGTCAAGTGEGEVMKNGLEGGKRVGKCVRV